DILDDGRRSLGTRVVIGNHQLIGALLGDPTHQRPLAAITVTAAAEDADQFPGHMGAQSGERLLQRVRRMRVIDDYQRLPFPTQTLHATGRGTSSPNCAAIWASGSSSDRSTPATASRLERLKVPSSGLRSSALAWAVCSRALMPWASKRISLQYRSALLSFRL